MPVSSVLTYPKKEIKMALPAIQPLSYRHGTQKLLSLPSMIPVRQTKWRELNYNSSKRYAYAKIAEIEDAMQDQPSFDECSDQDSESSESQ